MNIRRTRAFTMIEMIVVIVILGLLALIAIPTYNTVIDRTRTKSTEATLTAYAHEVQALAAFRGDGAILEEDLSSAAGDLNVAAGPGVHAAGLGLTSTGTATKTVASYHLAADGSAAGVALLTGNGKCVAVRFNTSAVTPVNIPASLSCTGTAAAQTVAAPSTGGGSETSGGIAPIVPAGCTNAQYKAEYYDNSTLSGTPVLVRCENEINNDWGLGTVTGMTLQDNFSVRWTKNVALEAGTYTFTSTTDDGVRVKVDGALVIDKWVAQSATTWTGQKTLTAGTHQIVVEYYERLNHATAKFEYAKTA